MDDWQEELYTPATTKDGFRHLWGRDPVGGMHATESSALTPAAARMHFAPHHADRPHADPVVEAGIVEAWAALRQRMHDLPQGAPQEQHRFGTPHTRLLAPVTGDDIAQAIRSLNPHGAAGPDGVETRHLRLGVGPEPGPTQGERPATAPGAACRAMVAHMATRLLHYGEYSDRLRHARLVPIPKPGRNSKVAANNRGLMVSSAAHRAIGKVLADRLQTWALECGQLPSEVLGFVQERSTHDAAHAVMAMAHARAMHALREHVDTVDAAGRPTGWGRETYVLMCDISKAYDRVDRRSLLTMLANDMDVPMPMELVRAIDAIYTDRTFSCVTAQGTAAPAALGTGLMQGDPLSCILFALLVSYVMRRMKQDPAVPGVWAAAGVVADVLHGRAVPRGQEGMPRRHSPTLAARRAGADTGREVHMCGTAYADDVSTLNATVQDCQRSATWLRVAFSPFGLAFEPTKSVIIVFTPRRTALPVARGVRRGAMMPFEAGISPMVTHGTWSRPGARGPQTEAQWGGVVRPRALLAPVVAN